MSDLSERLQAVEQQLCQSAAEGGYPAPKLIVVTKTHPAEELRPLLQLGVTRIGENRVQELTEKLPALREMTPGGGENLQVHLIGQLQSNKVKYIIEDVALIHSLDRLSLAGEIDRRAQAAGRVMPVLVQVSPAGEPQKGGMPPEDVLPFLRQVKDLPGLRVQGLMAVMPIADASPEGQAYLDGLFSSMRTLFERLRDEAIPGVEMAELSMGMSGDYPLAARHGATLVRVGSAILGQRVYPNKITLPGG